MEGKYCFYPHLGREEVEFPHVQPKLEAGCRLHVPVFGIQLWGGDTGYCPHCAMLGRGGINTADMGFELQHPNGRIDEICEEYAAVLMLQGISIIWGYMFE